MARQECDAVRGKSLDVSDEKVSDEDGCMSRSMTNKANNKTYSWRLAQLPVRDTSCAFDAREQGFHQRGIDEFLSARTDFCYLSDAPPDNAEAGHADQRCEPREGCKDSQRDNTNLKACACEEKSVVIMNTPDQNVNVIAELVFDMMLHSELEVTGRSIDSILNMITHASQADTAHIREPRCMTLQPNAARRKSDEDSAVAVQKGPAMISAKR